MMPIGRFSRCSGLSAKALRLYDELGLLCPAAIDIATGYRSYSPEQLPLAQRIKLLRSLEMPLAEIRALLAVADPEAARARLARHRDWLEARIGDYERALIDLKALDRWYREVGKERVMAQQDTSYRCSFCGKDRAAVERLIAGPNGVFICNECVALCNKLIDENTPAQEQEAPV